MSVTVKRGKWLVGIYKNASGVFEPIFTDNKKAALKFNNLSTAIENIKKLTDSVLMNSHFTKMEN
ncbi:MULTISPECIES: hypothetical protein [unclassified Lactobacillus]|uniref:hypothetical protein n=1 Tax=unclassified Lactobacillus TaxID=2620435 RepID=UPI002269C92F|nr:MULTISPECIES: hypothetical protein [unclassified Lactobacillus]MCX8721423.1 hypothetical protein [Lactobacillus sp. B4010]MCX8732407.1 hypothetical protein [Lactobacillus sp. B4015]MCX8734627.1 hypothetical protein [Lactobacillus sp. B4012]